MARFLISLVFLAGASANSLTPATYDDAVAGKSVFIKVRRVCTTDMRIGFASVI
jgi:hypothetical protein